MLYNNFNNMYYNKNNIQIFYIQVLYSMNLYAYIVAVRQVTIKT